MATITKCKCGRRMSKYAGRCAKCAEESHAKHVAEAKAVVASGKCPKCGAGLKRNNSLTGWWQCATTGIGNPNTCGFDCFTA